MEYLALVLLMGTYFAEGTLNSAPNDVHCEEPKIAVVTHVPKRRTTCTWKHDGEKPMDFRFEATLPSGLVTVKRGITSNSTKVDLDCFQNYGIIIYARYARPNGSEYLAPSEEISFPSGECAPPEITWYDHKASATSVVLERGLASTIHLNYTSGYNLTLEPDGEEEGALYVTTPPALMYEVQGLIPETTYLATLFPFFRAENGSVLKPRETIFKFKTQPLFTNKKKLES